MARLRHLLGVLLLTAGSGGFAQEPAPSSEPEKNPPASEPSASESSESSEPAAGEPATAGSAPAPAPDTISTIPVASEPAAAPSKDATQLDDVLVTAGRRLQKIDKVALAVSEVSGAAIESGVVRDTQSLVMLVPSLNIQYSGSEANATIRIRGVGTGGSNPGFESSVGVFIDDVYLPRPGLALNDLVDVQRVEVLRGPQGTLFGKNTTVGAIQIMTKPPNLYVTEASVSGGAGNYDAKVARASFSYPLVDNVLGLRLTTQYNKRDGYVTNTYNGERYNDRNRYLVRGQGLWKPFDDFSLRLIGSTIRKHERCCVAPYTQYNPATANNIRAHGGTVFDPPAEYTVAFDYTDTHSNLGEDSGSAHVEWNLGDYKVKGIGSYAKGFVGDKRDGDFSDVDYAYQPFVNAQTRIATGELSLQNNWWIFDWVVGGFYSNEKVAAQAQTLLGKDAGSFLLGPPTQPHSQQPAYPAGSGNLAMSHQDDKSYSVFTHNVIELPWDFEGTLGLRYLVETKQGGGVAYSNSPSCDAPLVEGGTVPSEPGVNDPTKTSNSLRALCGAPEYERSYDDKRVTGTGALARTFGVGLYAYVSYSQGFKAGGINLNPPSTVGGTYTFKPETVDNYEGGIRWPLFDGAFNPRVTYFVMDLKNYQLNTFDGTAFSVSNAGQVKGKGLEFESDLRLFTGVSLRGNYTHINTIYGPGTTDPTLVGKQLTNSPKNVGQISINARMLPGPWSVFGSLAARYQSAVNTGVDLDPAKNQKAYWLLNGRLGVELPNAYELSLIGSNLLNQYYRQIIFNAITRPPVGATATPGSYNGYPGNPRFFSVELLKRF